MNFRILFVYILLLSIFPTSKVFSQTQFLDLVSVNNISNTDIVNGDSLHITAGPNQYVRINTVFLTVEYTGSGTIKNNLSGYIGSWGFCAELYGQCLINNNDLLAKFGGSSSSILNTNYFGGKTIRVQNKVGFVLSKGEDAVIHLTLNNFGTSNTMLIHKILVSYEIYE
jgi:hypothetical protein